MPVPAGPMPEQNIDRPASGITARPSLAATARPEDGLVERPISGVAPTTADGYVT